MRFRPSGSLLFSVAVHTVLAVVLANVVLHYEIVFAPGPTPPPPAREQVTFVGVSPPGGALGGTTAEPPPRATQPSRTLVAPPQVPTGVAPPSQAPAAGGTPGGVAGGRGAGGGVGPTTGIVPGEPDPRLAADQKFFYPAPKTHGQRVDSAVRATIFAFNDSVARAAANAGRKPGDWTVENDGKKWGIDGNKIYLGKFSIPSAVLAALPIRVQSAPGEAIADRLSTTRRADVLLHAQSQYHHQEFKSAVKRIRARKARERREKARETDQRGVAQSSGDSR
jgi:hypothetical protein